MKYVAVAGIHEGSKNVVGCGGRLAQQTARWIEKMRKSRIQTERATDRQADRQSDREIGRQKDRYRIIGRHQQNWIDKDD